MGIAWPSFCAVTTGGARPLKLQGLPTCFICRGVLRSEGLAHVTGLEVIESDTERTRYFVGQNLRREELGTWNVVQGVPGIVTGSGEIWVGVLTRFLDPRAIRNPRRLLSALSTVFAEEPRRWCFVPATETGTQFRYPHELGDRLKNDYAGILCVHNKRMQDCDECSLRNCRKHP